eukprot:CAMPEP_0119307948 /NCGR_PEP_ID=MMETSP1333-20130426/8301_1 /TAXON_ID=418940 /ORGANISM="Scyphosphaera apsteinii, Strain RCC1455" /LENGTH=617 /DNA_ID=CAMNT_0007311607 /DNA_START=200 /DNA_END=2053 /DNA_ORIENTATION=-
MPQQHHPTEAEGYDPNSEEQLAERRKYDERLQDPSKLAAARKAQGDAEFKAKNYRRAYQHYSVALEATPDSHVLLGNRCQTYLRVGRLELALADAERAVELAPDWPKGRYRLGCCFQRLERPSDAIDAFEAACQLEPKNAEAKRALQAARDQQVELEKVHKELEIARKSTTRRQAYDAKAEAEYQAKQSAKRKGHIKEVNHWSEDLRLEFEKQYEAEWEPPPGVQLLTGPKEEDGPRIEDITEETGVLRLEDNNDDSAGFGLMLQDNFDDDGNRGGLMLEDNEGGGGLMLEDNEGGGGLMLEDNGGGLMLEDNEGGGGLMLEEDEEEEEDSEDDNYLTESSNEDERPPDLFEVGSTAIMLPPRNFTLVHEDGRLHKKDNFEPMSFGMQRVHHDSEPEPVWVQTNSTRWFQTTTEIYVIAYTVPKEMMKSSLLKVSFAPRQVHVSNKITGEVYVHGELENRIDPVASLWTTDGDQVTLTLVKQNLMIYDVNAKGAKADTHWHRLLTSDQYTERGMIDANYSGMPEHIRRQQKMAELKRKAGEEVTKQENTCPLCGKDVRFFCSCRDGDRDYERPLPEGWKKSELGFSDPLFDDVNYSLADSKQLQPKPKPQPQPYRGN